MFLVVVDVSGSSEGNFHMERPLGGSPHMWVFGDGGVSIYTPDGSELVKTVSAETACHSVESDSGSSIRCDWYDVISDGKKYVWAAASRGTSKIDVFSLNTGDLVGSFDTCTDVRDLDYHPLRDEVWVHCAQFSDMEQSHMDVFSATSPSVPITSQVVLHDNTPLRSYGQLQVDPTLGDVGYSTVYGSPKLHRVDLSQRMVEESFDLGQDNPKFYGVYDMTYSAKNQHLFLRSQVCCTCGFAGADTTECGRYGSENITIRYVDTIIFHHSS